MSQNLHKTNSLGWWVWIENRINNFQMMGKTISWLFVIGFTITLVAAYITTHLGLYEMRLDSQFYLNFFKLSLQSIAHPESRDSWEKALKFIFVDIFLLLFIHSFFGGIVIYFLFDKIKKQTLNMSKTEYIKGTRLVSEKNRILEIKRMVELKKIETGFEIGRIPFPISSENNHVLIIAASGGGKGVLLSKVMLRAGRLKNIKGIVHDIKPEWILSSYRPDRGDLIFNPLDARSVKWTVWNDISDEEGVADIKNFCLWVVPDLQSAKDPFWQTSARMILESIMLFLWQNNKCTNADIRFMINLSSAELSTLLKGFPAEELIEKKDSLTTLKTQMQWVDFLPDGDFSIKKWIKQERGLLFLSNTEKTQGLFKPLLTLFVNAVGSYILSLPDDRNRRIYFFLDEFTALSKLDKIIDLLKMGRSKGVSMWFAFQDFQQLRKIYSDDDMRTIFNNCKNVAIGQIQEPQAAKYLSEKFGKQEFYEKSNTQSMGVAANRDGLSLSEQRREDYVVKDSDLLNLPEREFFVKINGYEGVTRTTADIIKVHKIAEGFVNLNLSKEEQLSLILAKETSYERILRYEEVLETKVKNEKKHNDEDEISREEELNYH